MYFRFDEFDEAIDEAIEIDVEADGGGRVYHSLSSSRLASILLNALIKEQQASIFSHSPQCVSQSLRC